MHTLDGIQHISFDLWLTLIKSNPEFKPLRNQLFARHFDIQRDPEDVAMAIRHFDLLFNNMNERTGRNVHYSEILYVILDYLGTPIDKISANDMEAYYQQMETLFFAFPPVLIDANTKHILQIVRDKGITLNILSNTGFILGNTLRKLLNHLDMEPYFCFQIYSDEMGHSKPSEIVYGRVFQELQSIKTLSKQAVLHIGDNQIADVQGAANFGFQSLLIDSKNTLSKIFLP
jgi:putative hydrolase of the HAD superfamily